MGCGRRLSTGDTWKERQETGPQCLGCQAMEFRADSAITENGERTGASQEALVLKKPTCQTRLPMQET